MGGVNPAPGEGRATGISRTGQRGMLRISGKSRISQDDKNRVDSARRGIKLMHYRFDLIVEIQTAKSMYPQIYPQTRRLRAFWGGVPKPGLAAHQI